MSMELFLECKRDGETASFKRSLFEEIMGRGAVAPQFPLTGVEYADGGALEIDGGEDDDITSLTFSRFGGDTFFDRLWELADRTGSFLWWPGMDRQLAATRDDVANQIDADMVDEMGPPYVVANGKELAEAVLGDADDLDDFEEE